MPGTANGDPKSELQAEGSLAGFETLEVLLEVHFSQVAADPETSRDGHVLYSML